MFQAITMGLSLLIFRSGTNPASEKRSANAYIAGKPNIQLAAVLRAEAAALSAKLGAPIQLEDGIFDVVLADGTLPKPGKINAAAKVLDVFPGQPYHPAKRDAEGNVITDAEGKAVLEAFWAVRVALQIEQPALAPAQA